MTEKWEILLLDLVTREWRERKNFFPLLFSPLTCDFYFHLPLGMAPCSGPRSQDTVARLHAFPHSTES